MSLLLDRFALTQFLSEIIKFYL